ncbi:MAG: hypothetical protein AVDCRST_MAG49-1350, partial [uncultured Thermomicrobiales bacterium]
WRVDHVSPSQASRRAHPAISSSISACRRRRGRPTADGILGRR